MATDNKKTTQEVATTNQREKGEVVYQVAGQDVKLSYQIVRDYLTKGNGNVSDQDLTQFISICKYNELNPFLSEAYLVKFGQQPAQMIVSREAMMKRAEAHPEYAGIKGGILVENKDGGVEKRSGSFHLKTEKLVGGWAEVYRKDREFPAEATVSFWEYDKKQSTWSEKPGTMITKVAKVQALREAFPSQLGAMYTQEEVQPQVEDTTYTEVKDEVEAKANKKTIGFNQGAAEGDHAAETLINTDTGEVIETKAEQKQWLQGQPAGTPRQLNF